MNAYKELRDKQEKDYSDHSTAKYAYGRDQFARIMEEWDLDPEEDQDKLIQVAPGAFILKTDRDQFHELMQRLDDEMKAAIASDQTGDGFVYDMFYYELNNHEYSYTWSIEDTLDYLGYTRDQIAANPILDHGLRKAIDQIKKDVENGDIW